MEAESTRFVKIVWEEPDCNGMKESHIAHGALVSEAGDMFVLKVEDKSRGDRLLYIAKRATIKMIDEPGVRQ